MHKETWLAGQFLGTKIRIISTGAYFSTGICTCMWISSPHHLLFWFCTCTWHTESWIYVNTMNEYDYHSVTCTKSTLCRAWFSVLVALTRLAIITKCLLKHLLNTWLSTFCTSLPYSILPYTCLMPAISTLPYTTLSILGLISIHSYIPLCTLPYIQYPTFVDAKCDNDHNWIIDQDCRCTLCFPFKWSQKPWVLRVLMQLYSSMSPSFP